MPGGADLEVSWPPHAGGQVGALLGGDGGDAGLLGGAEEEVLDLLVHHEPLRLPDSPEVRQREVAVQVVRRVGDVAGAARRAGGAGAVRVVADRQRQAQEAAQADAVVRGRQPHVRQRGRQQPGPVAGPQVRKVAQRARVWLRLGHGCGDSRLCGAEDAAVARSSPMWRVSLRWRWANWRWCRGQQTAAIQAAIISANTQ